MLKRVVTAAVGVVGLVLVGLGIASATIWRADDVLVATASGSAFTYVTDPGVLEMGGDPATVTITAPDDAHVVLAVGRDTDVAGWIGTDPSARVTGLSGWHTLATTTATGGPPAPETATPTAPTPAASPTAGATDAAGAAGAARGTAADPTGSDLWVQQATGNGSATLTWQAQPGRWSLIAVSTGTAAPTLSISWPRVVTTPWLWPLVVVGVLLALGAAAMLLWELRRRRRGPDAEWTPVTTGAIPAVADGEPTVVLTRRQLREAALARTTRPRTGAVPTVAAPSEASSPAAPPNPARTAPTANEPTDDRPTEDPARTTAGPDAPTPGAPASQPATGPIATSRRALRTAATASPAKPAATDDASPAISSQPSAAAPAPITVAPTPSTVGRTPSTAAPAPSAVAPASGAGRPVPGAVAPTSSAAGSTPSAVGPTPGATSPTPSALGPASGPAGGAHPAHTVRPTWVPVAPTSATTPATPTAPVPATSPAAANPAAPGVAGHPRWLGTRTGAEGAPPTSPVLPPPGPQRGVLPPPAPQRDAGAPDPDASGDTDQTAGSRADAWRRAWGLPPVDQGDSTTGEGRHGR